LGLIQIDENKCKKDGLCVSACPMVIIRQQDKESCPELIPGTEHICLVCGHCVAVCPHEAFSHQKMTIESCSPIVKENVIRQDQAVQYLRSRRSIHNFKDKSLGKKQIQELIEIARYAPTGSNSQPVVWTVFTDKDDLKNIAEMTINWIRSTLENPQQEAVTSTMSWLVASWDNGFDVVTRNAPVLVFASVPSETRNNLVNLSIALTYMELAAVRMGLGACWAGGVQSALLQSKPLQEYIDLPESHNSHYPMMLGYPRVRYHRLPERNPPVIIWK
jgi:nitroreductase/ferredoxin